jgi:hypothetical protein
MPAALEFTCEGWLENLFNANVNLCRREFKMRLVVGTK